MSKWRTPSGSVHQRRLRWYIGTPFEMHAQPTEAVNLLCGSRQPIKEVPLATPVTCGVCVKAINTGAHHL